MLPRTIFPLLSSLLLCLWWVIGAQAQQPSPSFDAAQQQGVQKNPPGVTFTLTLALADGRTQYHHGERIPLDLAFSSSLPDKYKLDVRLYDRSGRADMDDFYVDRPDDAVDPLRTYLELGSIGGGPGIPPPLLDARPQRIERDLNEWLRFDKPGRYRLYVTSGRLNPFGHTAFNEPNLNVTSNTITFDILPDDPAWDEATLQAAVKALDGPDTNDDPETGPHVQAARALRFLGTNDAVREMVRRLKGVTDAGAPLAYEYHLGLWCALDRTFVVREMRRQAEAPDFPVTSSFLRDLSRLESYAENPPPLPPYTGDPASVAQRQAQYAKRMADIDARRAQDATWLAEVADRKRGQARAESLYTLYGAESDHPLSDKRRAYWTEKMVAVFNDLPLDDQQSLLSSYSWARIGGKAWLPLLRQLTKNAPPPDTPYQSSLYDLAVQRLYELAPAEGRQIILAQIRQPKPRLSLNVLTRLPDTRLPQLDDALAKNLKDHGGSWEAASALVARYATAAILPRVKAAYGDQGGQWACAFQAALLSYFLRTEPAYGATQLNKALDSRKNTGCWQSVLADVAAYGMTPTLERITIARLDNPDPTIVTNAAQALGAHGSPAAEAPLWQRLRKLYTQWQDKPGQFIAQEKGRANQQRPEVGLAQALATSPNWVVGPAALAEIKRLCIAPDTFTQAQIDLYGDADKDKVPVYADQINPPHSWDDDQWRIGQYRLISLNAVENKMMQYPRGTVFVWLSQPPTASTQRERQAFTQLKAFLAKRGMTLQDPGLKQ